MRLILAFLLLLSTTPILAGTDAKGSRDHPDIGRFKGSWILGYSYKEFDEYALPTGPIKRNEQGEYVAESTLDLEGEITRILYIAPKEASVAQVFRSFVKSLQAKGYKVLYQCKDCYGNAGYLANFQPELADYTYHIGKNRYASLERKDPAGDMHVSLLVYDYNFDYYSSRYGHPAIQLDVIRSEPLQDDQIEVLDAKTLADELEKAGTVTLKGIYFDTDKAVLKPESMPAVLQVATLMNSQPEMKLHVVGHTDNTGSFQHNMNLSRARAQAVADNLIRQQGIAAQRLTANGVGPLAPVAPNTTEEGRARNRRVELVAQ